MRLFVADYAEAKALQDVALEKLRYAQLVRAYEEDLARAKTAKERRIREAEQAARQQNFEKNLSVWDGSLPSLVHYTKEHMNDPSTFSHVETRYQSDGPNFVVRMEFRAKNAFGAVIKSSITAKVDGDGQVLQVLRGDR
jgi:hypothetical protein